VSSVTQSPGEIRRLVAEREWYHTMELAPGVTTPGFFDHRPLVPRLPFPASLAGRRCLDIATFDGFWAFEMERRGADEVIAIDILDPLAWDWPFGSGDEVVAALERRKQGGMGFRIAADLLGSSVQHVECSVYDLDPAVHGTFDFVYMGSLLMHLRDPVRALERTRSVCSGTFLLVDNVDLLLSCLSPRRPLADLDGVGRPWWWKPNLAALRRMVTAAGFEVVAGPRPVLVPAGPEIKAQRLPARALVSRSGRQAALRARVGDPHAYLLARPR
jgi:tRNA (mo5U34)-methyltransferase